MCEIATVEELRKIREVLEDIRDLLDEDVEEDEGEPDADLDDFKEGNKVVKK